MKGNNNVKRLPKPEVVVITGASAGLGRATARAFAIEGAHIGLLAVWLNQTAATTCGSLYRPRRTRRVQRPRKRIQSATLGVNEPQLAGNRRGRSCRSGGGIFL